MIDVNTGIKVAKEFIGNFFDKETLLDLRLEEVELSEDNNYWEITLGYNVPNSDPNENPISLALGGSKKYLREYKVLKIDTKTGKFRSMKMRQP